MKRTLIILMILLWVVSLAACSSDINKPNTSKINETSETKSGYAPVYNSVTIAMNAPASPIIEAIGEPLGYFEAKSCAFKGLDKTYTYSGMQLLTYPIDEVDYVYSVVFMDDNISTTEGVALGDKLADVSAVYGEGFVKDLEMYTYTKNDSSLSFLFENGIVSSIEYNAVTK